MIFRQWGTVFELLLQYIKMPQKLGDLVERFNCYRENIC